MVKYASFQFFCKCFSFLDVRLSILADCCCHWPILYKVIIDFGMCLKISIDDQHSSSELITFRLVERIEWYPCALLKS
jgi:hypothetical protein